MPSDIVATAAARTIIVRNCLKSTVVFGAIIFIVVIDDMGRALDRLEYTVFAALQLALDFGPGVDVHALVARMEVVHAKHLAVTLHQLTLRRALGNDAALVLQRRHRAVALAELVGHRALSGLVALTDHVDFGQVILVLLDALLPVLLEHIVIILELRVSAGRHLVAAKDLRVAARTVEGLLAAVVTHRVAQHRPVLVAANGRRVDDLGQLECRLALVAN